MANVKPVNLAEKLTLASDLREPRVVGQYNGHDLVLVKVSGVLHHALPQGVDPYFHVVQGVLDIDVPGDRITLRAGDMHVVPAGETHRAVARDVAHVLVIRAAAPDIPTDPVRAAPKAWV